MDGVVAAARGGSAGRLREWVDKGGSIDGHLDEVCVCLAAHSPVRAWLLRHPAAAVVILIDSQACARWTPLHFAAADGHIVACKSLLGVGADANSVVPGDGYRPLHLAARFGQPETVDTLLIHGADVDGTDSFGHTALHFAAAFGHRAAAEALVKYGASVSLADDGGFTPAQVARQAGHTELADMLTEASTRRSAKARLRDWLASIHLHQYFNDFLAQGFDDVDFLSEAGLTEEDLDAIGVRLAGHRKKLQKLYQIDQFVAKAPEEPPAPEEEDDEDEEEEDEEEDEEEEEESD